MFHKSERLLEYVISKVYEDYYNYPESDSDDLEGGSNIPSKDSYIIVARLTLDFNKPSEIPLILNAARLFRQYGHRIIVGLKEHRFFDLNLDKELLLELIEAGQINLNREMEAFANNNRFDEVKILILNGANPNYWNGSLGQTGLLQHCIANRDCDANSVEFLLNSGATVQKSSKEMLDPLVIAFYRERYDVVKILIRHKAPCHNFTYEIIRSGHLELFEDAAAVNYPFEISDRDYALRVLLDEHKFALVEKLLVFTEDDSIAKIKEVLKSVNLILSIMPEINGIREHEEEAYNKLVETARRISEYYNKNI